MRCTHRPQGIPKERQVAHMQAVQGCLLTSGSSYIQIPAGAEGQPIALAHRAGRSGGLHFIVLTIFLACLFVCLFAMAEGSTRPPLILAFAQWEFPPPCANSKGCKP